MVENLTRLKTHIPARLARTPHKTRRRVSGVINNLSPTYGHKVNA